MSLLAGPSCPSRLTPVAGQGQTGSSRERAGEGGAVRGGEAPGAGFSQSAEVRDSSWHGASWAAGQRPSSFGSFHISKRGKVLTSGPAGGFCQHQQQQQQPVWSFSAGERLYNPRQCSETVRSRSPQSLDGEGAAGLVLWTVAQV